MGIEFYGMDAKGEAINIGFEHADFLALNIGNGAALLGLLGTSLENGYGEMQVFEARRRIMVARAGFARRAPRFTREGSDTQRPGFARCISQGLDAQGLADRLDRFERCLNALVAAGAVSIYWA